MRTGECKKKVNKNNILYILPALLLFFLFLHNKFYTLEIPGLLIRSYFKLLSSKAFSAGINV